MTFLLYFTSLFFLYHSICSTLLFSNHMFQVSWNYSLVVQNSQFSSCVNDLNQEMVKVDRKYDFLKKLVQFHLYCFLSQSLCLSLSKFKNKKSKLLTVTSEARNISLILIVTRLFSFKRSFLNLAWEIHKIQYPVRFKIRLHNHLNDIKSPNAIPFWEKIFIKTLILTITKIFH